MADDYNTIMLNFIRDAQWRIAELAEDIYKFKEENKMFDVMEADGLRSELIFFLDLAFEPDYEVRNGINIIEGIMSRQQQMIEAQRLRERARMNDVPYLTWAGYTPQLIQKLTSALGGNLPVGGEDQIITYDGNGTPIAITLSPDQGYDGAETIEQYFSS